MRSERRRLTQESTAVPTPIFRLFSTFPIQFEIGCDKGGLAVVASRVAIKFNRFTSVDVTTFLRMVGPISERFQIRTQGRPDCTQEAKAVYHKTMTNYLEYLVRYMW